MTHQASNDTNSSQTRFRSILHMIMGALYLVLGVSVIGLQAFGEFELDPGIAYVMGTILCLYGGFRLWRGYSGMRQS